jgi:Pyruvate/2-oxoacid:ferredoxin oxidoreductase delta subunit
MYQDTSILAKVMTKAVLKKKTDCTHTMENCLKFDEQADHVIETGLGREITLDEALAIIKASEKEGLVHFTDNRQDAITYLCNCCSDCCVFLTLIKVGIRKRDSIVATYYRRETDAEKCISCGVCVKDCPMGLIKMEKGQLPVINLDKCTGCGLCLRHCGKKAARLVRRDDNVPFVDAATLYKEKFAVIRQKHGDGPGMGG